MKLKGNFLYWDQKNLNNRTYSKEAAQKIVDQFNESDGAYYGEMGYPKEELFGLVRLAEVSHRVEEIHINEEEKSIEGTIQILDTPKGLKLQQIIEEMKNGSPIGLSCRPRGTGEVNEKGEIENFNLISFDIIPTAKDAFANIKENDSLKEADDE